MRSREDRRPPGARSLDRERIFQPFQRLGASQPGGVGLGLAVAHGFLTAMGATIEIDDTPGVAVNLRARGYDVDVAATGEEALDLASRHHPDLVLLDLGLPGISGIDVIRGLRG